MKCFINVVILLITSLNGFCQVMQASIGPGSSATRVIVYIRPASAVNGTISTLQFSVAIDASVVPAPVVSIVGTPAFGVTWNIDPSYLEAGHRIYNFTTAASPSVSIGAGAETPVMEIEFAGGLLCANNVSLLTLPAGGVTTGNTLFFCSGAATSVEGQLYYTRAGTTVANNNSYTGSLNSSATPGDDILSLNGLSFNVIKQGNDGLINLAVRNDETNHHYDLQRSTNGANFTTITTINKSQSSTYNYTDLAITNQGVSTLYYRLKQVDTTGKISYSDTRLLQLDTKGTQITVFPNPVKDGFYVSIPFINSNNSMVKLNLVSTNGQLVGTKEITTLQAVNYYFNIADKGLAAGNYNLVIIFEDKIMETKSLIINR
jgi:hypothetical protein